MNIIALEALTFGLTRLVTAAEKFGCLLTLITRDKSIYEYELSNLSSKNFKIIEIDTFNNTEIINTIKKEQDVVGILSMTDTWSIHCLEVSQSLKLPSMDPEVISLVRDKYRLRNHLYDAGLTSKRSKRVNPKHFDRDQVSKNIHYPCIVKDAAGTGSQNVWIAYNDEALLKTLDRAANEVLRGEITVEPFFSGTLYSIETLSWQGETRVLAINSRIISPEPLFREEALASPVTIGLQDNAKLKVWIESVLQSIKYHNGFAHTEFMVTGNGFEIIEVNPRLGGVQIGEALCQLTGINIYEAWVEMALGNRPSLMDIPIQFEKGIGQLIVYANETGVFSHVEGIERLSNHPGKPIFYPTSYSGKNISTTHDQRASIGVLFAEGESSEIALLNAFAARNKLRIVMKS